MLPVETPFKIYTGLDGKALQNGYVYFGLPGQNPITAPVTVYWDAAGTQPAVQPLRTTNGYIVRAGTPANVFFTGSYSELVQDAKQRQVFYAHTSDEFSFASSFVANLASSAGSSLVGNGGETVADSFNALQLADYTALRAYVGPRKSVYVTGYLALAAPSGIAGMFVRDDSDTTTADNGGTVIVASNGKRWKRAFGDSISPMQFSAVGSGVADDSAAITSAIAALPDGAWLDGKGGTYKVSGVFNVAAATFRMRNFKFVTDSSYAAQANFVITSLMTEFKNVTVDGGRGTYKVGVEPWLKFSTFGGYDSIQPSLPEFFKITNWSEEARVSISDVDFINMHAKCCILVNTYGTVLLNRHTYSNISNKTYHVYHSPDNGVTQFGRTIVGSVSSRDVGLLPNNFTVDGVATTFATTTAMPQGSFNFIVSHGIYILSDASVKNYASCGVTADRNTIFSGANIVIKNDSARSMSNNPSGGMWLENCKASAIDNLTIDIQDRDPRDTALDSSALQLYCETSQTHISNLKILGNVTTAKLRKAIRGSMYMKAIISIDGGYIDGLYTQRPVDFGVLPNSVIGHEVKLKNVKIVAGDLNIDQPKLFEMDDVQMAGNITLSVSGNPGITGTVGSATFTASSFGTLTNNLPLTYLGVIGNGVLGTIACGTVPGTVAIEGNQSMAAIAITGSATARVSIKNNGLISSTTLVTAANSVTFSGNTTSRRVEFKDVQTFNMSGNNIRSASGEPLVWIHPVTLANVLAGVVEANNILIQTGTVGAGYYDATGVTGVIESGNNKLTVAWT